MADPQPERHRVSHAFNVAMLVFGGCRSSITTLPSSTTTAAPGPGGGVLWLITSRLVTWCSTMTLISAVGVAITPRLVFGVLSVGVLIAWIATVVPFGLGLADGGNYALYDLLGASGVHGAFVTMLNRVRSLAVAAVGFTVMAVVHTLNRLALARMRARLRDHRAQLRAP